MFKISKEEFLDEVTAELMGYEEISNEKIDEFVNKVDSYIEKHKGKDKRIIQKADDIILTFKDETDIFQMVDQYYVAVVNNETNEYWNDWKL